MISGLGHFTLVAIHALVRIAYNSSIGLLVDPRKSYKFFCNVLDGVDRNERDPLLPNISVIDFLEMQCNDSGSHWLQSGEILQIDAGYCDSYLGGTGSLLEIVSLASLTRVLKPQLIFEIGTFKGRTTRLFALNSSDNCTIITLDLEQAKVPHRIGEAFQGTKECKKIRQLFGDSTKIDLSEFAKKCDIVWVDACHDYNEAKIDSQTALKLVRPGGLILWHDYRHSASFSGVTKAIRELSDSGYPCEYLLGTTIAALRMPAQNIKSQQVSAA